MADAEEGDREQSKPETSVQEQLHLLIGEKRAHESLNAPIGCFVARD
jgi:hypothetical protein